MKTVLILMIWFIPGINANCQQEAIARKLTSIDSLMNAANEIGVFNGNILLTQQGKTVYQKQIGFSDTTKTKFLIPNSRFAIGSITKEFHSVGILLLQEKGKLNIDDKVSTYLPALPGWAATIQIKQLLQYTSGLPQANGTSDSDLMQHLLKLDKLEFEPGTSYNYSNYNVFIQRKIIEKVTGLTYTDFISNYFFKPLKMDGVLINPAVTATTIAQSFDNDYNTTTSYQGANELYLTIDDLFKWSQAINSYKIVNKRSTSLLAQNFPNGEGSFGSAVFANDTLITHTHQGSGNNYEALLYSNGKDDITIILMTNNQNFKVNQLKDAIENIVNNKPYTVPKKSIYLDIRKKLLDDFNQGIAFYNVIRATGRDKYDFASEVFDLYSTGKYLMRRNRFDDAVKIFDLSIMADIKNTGGISYAYTLIGECYLKSGNNELAVIYYSKAAALDPANKTATGMLTELSHQKK